jgi:hypothetical protein
MDLLSIKALRAILGYFLYSKGFDHCNQKARTRTPRFLLIAMYGSNGGGSGGCGGYRITIYRDLIYGRGGRRADDVVLGSRIAPQSCQDNSNPAMPACGLGRNQPHCTRYNRSGSIADICRCADPASHGDAFTKRRHVEDLLGRPVLDINSQPLPWEEAQHRVLDALGKDRATVEERHAVLDQVYAPETVALIRRHDRLSASPEGSRLQYWVESDIIWHGRVNPWGWRVVQVESIVPEMRSGLATMYDQDGTLNRARMRRR